MTGNEGPDGFAAAFGVSRETMARLEAFRQRLVRWNAAINLTAAGSLVSFWQRHAADSAQLLRFANEETVLWADLGTGGGFPGLVLAILAQDRRTRFVLVESDARKAAFLSQTARDLAPGTEVLNQRAETLAPLGAEVLSARALAPLERLLPLAERHLAPGGKALFLKGAGAGEELTRARRSWKLSCTIEPSRTDPAGSILIIGAPRRA